MNPDIQSVLFEINADYNHDTKPFCDITKFSHFNQEQEVLFSIGYVFRIESVQNLDNGLCKVTLTLTKEEDEQLKQLKEHFQIELDKRFNLNSLGELMLHIGKYEYAQQYFSILLQKTNCNKRIFP